MDFSDERYVRVYTRDTITWISLGFNGQSLFLHLLRKVDRAGVLEIGNHDPTKAVAAMTGAPLDLVRAELPTLVELGCAELVDGALVIPRFIEAQETERTDAARARESRARRRDKKRSESRNVTLASHNVTVGHETEPTPPPCVTPRHSVLNRPDLSAAPAAAKGGADAPVVHNLPASDFALSSPDLSPAYDPKDLTGSAREQEKGQIMRIFDTWKQDTGHFRAVLDAKREKRIRARLREGFTAERCCAAIVNRRNDPFLMGQNDTGRVYDGLETILRDAAQVERLERLIAPLRPQGSVRNVGPSLVQKALQMAATQPAVALGGKK